MSFLQEDLERSLNIKRKSLESTQKRVDYLQAPSKLEGLDPLSLFDYSSSSVKGLFTKSPRFFLLQFSDSYFIATAAISLRHEPRFHCEYKAESFEECGMSFSSYIEIRHEQGSFKIKIPAARSYDPAGRRSSPDDGERVSEYQHAFILALAAIETHAALVGVDESDLETLQDALRDVMREKVRKDFLVQWIHLQVKMACYRKIRPPTFGEFLLTKAMTQKILLDTTRLHTKEYLEKVLAYNKGDNTVKFENEATMPDTSGRTTPFTDPLKLAKRGVLKEMSKISGEIGRLVQKGELLSRCTLTVVTLEAEFKESRSENCEIF